jgi:hypothetical protein
MTSMSTRSRIVTAAGAAVLACCLSAAPVMAKSAATHAPTAQQQRMKSCNSDASAKSLKGNDRKSFMKSCLSGHGTASASTPHERMKSCNTQASAKSLKGADRKAFMSSCLKAH